MNEKNMVTSNEMNVDKDSDEFNSFYGQALFIKTPEERFANREGERRKGQEMIACMREKGFTEEQIFDIFGKSEEPADLNAGEEALELKRHIEEASLDEFSRISYALREGAQRKEQEIYARMLEKDFTETQLREIFLNNKGTLVIFHKMTPEEKAQELERITEKTRLDWNSALNYARREGRREGRQEVIIARMRENGFTEEQIRDIFGDMDS